MPTIKIEVVAGAQTHTRTKTISGPHLTRLVAAYRKIYGQVQDGQTPEGVPIMRDRTDAEVLAAWADGIFAGTRANVLGGEREDAATAAKAAIADLALT